MAYELGFDMCKIAKADFLDPESRQLEAWLNQGKHGSMSYMENHFDLRTDPRKLVLGAKSVICLAVNYFPNQMQRKDAPQIAKYAYGKDYHKVIKKLLKQLLHGIQQKFGEIQGRCFVDSAPVMEKAWAKRAGIGWQAKNSNMLTKKMGSFYFLAEIICDLELEADNPVKDYCGSCTKCIDACPTDAINTPYEVDGSKCISYFTIELKDQLLPEKYKGKFNNWMFGCDICQDVCPINARTKPHQIDAFEPKEGFLEMHKQQWEEITEEVFNQLFEGSAVKRTKFEGLKRNITFLK